MWINAVMKTIWQPYTEQYEQKFTEYMNWPLERLIRHIKLIIQSHIKSTANGDQEIRSTTLVTCGCPHWNRRNGLCACSFCDYFSDLFPGYIMMSVLKERSSHQYAKMVRFSFDQARGIHQKPLFAEHVTAFDTLNDQEINGDTWRALFEDSLYGGNIKLYICETRASSVSSKKIQEWNNQVGPRFLVENGVDVSNEWLRNHWLNKQISNSQIVNAWKAVHDENCQVINDILLGIPGLTDKQSIAIFEQSFQDLQNADFIVVSPLVRKGVELQNTIYRYLSEDCEMLKIGAAKHSLTGSIHPLAIYRAIIGTFSRRPDLLHKYIHSPPHFDNYIALMRSCYQYDRDYIEVEHSLCGLVKFNETKDLNQLIEAYEKMKGSLFYQEYDIQYQKEWGIEKLMETMSLVSKKLEGVLPSDVIKSENFDFELAEFELDSYRKFNYV